ncbi:T9SS type A sorting domain-containing protein [Hymenobacter sp. UYAg731]
MPAQVRNLTYDAPAPTGLAAPLKLTLPTTVSQALTIASTGNFDLNGQTLTLPSSAAGTALVVNSAAGRVLGTATVERYIDPAFNAGPGYRYYSPPVTGLTVADLATANFTPVVNPAYNTNTSTTPVTPFPTVFTYDPTRVGSPSPAGLPAIERGRISPTALTDPLVVGKGYALQIPVNAKVRFVGTLFTDTLTVRLPARNNVGPLAANAGWNLVGNPYPAPLDWTRVAPADRPNLDAAIYTYVSTGASSGFYTASINGWGDSPIVASGQSFFVRTKDTLSATPPVPRLRFRNSQRVTSYGTQPAFNRPAAVGRGVQLEFRNGGGGGGGKPPHLAVYEFSGRMNSNGDAYRIINPNGPNLGITAATLASEDELAVKAFSALSSGLIVPLTVTVFQTGTATYTIKADTVQGLLPGVSAYLDDLQGNNTVNLGVAPYTYSFTLAAPPSGPIKNRFQLRFGPTVVTATTAQAATRDIALYPNPAQSQVWVQIPGVPGTAEVQATLFNELGQMVLQQVASLVATGTRLPLNVQSLAHGVYALRLQIGSAIVVRRLVVE